MKSQCKFGHKTNKYIRLHHFVYSIATTKNNNNNNKNRKVNAFFTIHLFI